MGTLVIKNLPEGLHAKLRARARRNHRSLTKEMIALVEASVDAPSKPAPVAEPIDRAVTIDEIEAAIRDGRFAHYRSLDEVNAWIDELRQDRDVAP